MLFLHLELFPGFALSLERKSKFLFMASNTLQHGDLCPPLMVKNQRRLPGPCVGILQSAGLEVTHELMVNGSSQMDTLASSLSFLWWTIPPVLLGVSVALITCCLKQRY